MVSSEISTTHDMPSVFLKIAALAGFSLLTTHHSLFAADVSSAEFPPELFPGLAGKSESDIRLAGIAALNPDRLVRGEPKLPVRPVPEMRKTLHAVLPRGGDYLRVYTLDTEAVAARAGRGALVVDCRYLSTASTETDACAAFVAALAGVAPIVTVRGDHPPATPTPAAPAAPAAEVAPVLVMVNAETTGPLEAMLAAAQAEGRLMLVGATTGGKTAVYKPLAGESGWWAISGEILPASGGSLVGVGVTPKFPVKVSPEDEFLAWQIVERGAPLASVLQRDSLGKTESAAPAKPGEKPAEKPADPAHAAAIDPAMQRAQDVLAALQVLGRR